ncbi:UNVERIFIED_CONTAM: hypothetical protein Scaly_2038500 [Sesamum calycinum]|uniref:Transposase-associated domain-containing protein n=1 Tax=Sesamum calycinum TaxID=2727403 RepID=A0AAW2N1N2_9LAMI
MYNKNLPRRAGLTPEFEDRVKTFIKWAKGQRRHMNGDKIRCPCRKCKNTKFGMPDEVSYHLCMQGFMPEYYNWISHGEDIVQDYFEAPSVPQVSEEPTPTGHFEGVLDDGTWSCSMDVGPNSYFFGGGSYDYDESRYKRSFRARPTTKEVPLCCPKVRADNSPSIEVVFFKSDAEHMTWHTTQQIEEGSICHPSDAEAWKHFNRMYPDFAKRAA